MESAHWIEDKSWHIWYFTNFVISPLDIVIKKICMYSILEAPTLQVAYSTE